MEVQTNEATDITITNIIPSSLNLLLESDKPLKVVFLLFAVGCANKLVDKVGCGDVTTEGKIKWYLA